MAQVSLKSGTGISLLDMEELPIWYTSVQTYGASPYTNLTLLKVPSDPYGGLIRISSNTGITITGGIWSGTVTGFDVVDPVTGVSVAITGLTLNALTVQNSLKSGNALDFYKNIVLGGNDTITGTSGNDHLLGGAGNDTIYGGAGNDYLRGMNGDDTVYGQTGNDTYRVRFGIDNNGVISGGSDILIENGNDGADRLRVYSSGGLYTTAELSGTDLVIKGYDENGVVKQTTTLKNQTVAANKIEYTDLVDDNYDEVFATYLNSSTLTGSTKNDLISGTSASETLSGGDGDDFLMGGSGNDTLRGGNGDDRLDGGFGNDTLNGEAGNDTYIIGGAFVGNDTIQDTSGDEDILQVNTELLDSIDVNVQRSGTNNANLVFDFYKNGTKVQTTTVLNEYNGNRIEYFDAQDSSFVISSAKIDVNGKLVGTNLNEFLVGSAFNNLIQGGGGDDAIFGGNGNDTLYGGWGDDYLNAGFGTDVLYGDSGNDNLDGHLSDAKMYGGTGDDWYDVDSASDLVVEKANEGKDGVSSTLSTYTLTANVENLQLEGVGNIVGKGNELNNWIGGNSGNNILYGYAGDDGLDGKAGNDTMYGGLGNDNYTVDSTGDVVVENANEGQWDNVNSSVTYTLGANVENLYLKGTNAINGYGNASNNNIYGNSANNILYGYAGDDWIDGKEGNDTMYGGLGNDNYTVDSIGDVVVENSNEGQWDNVNSSITYTLSANVENLYLQGTNAINGYGNVSNNNINGNSTNNILFGYAGDDYINGNAGNDTMHGGLGNDNYTVDSTGDVVVEKVNEGQWDNVNSSVTYTLGANVENLNLDWNAGAINGYGNSLNNYISGNAASNVLYGYDGDDSLDGRDGNDTMVGGKGNDNYSVDSLGDVITELAGNAEGQWDNVNSTISYTLAANVENLSLAYGWGNINGTGNASDNFINGNADNNVLSGLAGADNLNGNDGNDTLIGGLGNDYLQGGTGADIFRFESALNSLTNKDTVADFLVGTDKIQLENAIFTKLTSTGTLNAANFKIGNATDSNDYILFNATTKVLSYDPDGNGAGAAVEFAVLNYVGVDLKATDFVVI